MHYWCTTCICVIVVFAEWVEPVKQEFLKKLTYANMKRNLQAQIRYFKIWVLVLFVETWFHMYK